MQRNVCQARRLPAAWCALALLCIVAGARGQALPVYSIGNPTDEEQYWLEEVNYERANPQAEAKILDTTANPDVLAQYNYFDVNLSAMVSAFSAIKAAPPLSMNAELLASSEGHSQDMFTNTYQGHIGSDGSTAAQRIAAQGYNAITDGENVFAFATSDFEGNAAFEVDWGAGTNGMQSPPGHRENDHDGAYAEIGIGIVDGQVTASGTTFGPMLCTMDFGTQQTYTPFVTGVVYYDLNDNGAYDMGEGLGGVTVNVSGASYSGITANSGGYSVPVSGSGTQVVTFSINGLPEQQATVTLTGTSNAKVDLNLTYTPPVVSGTEYPPLNVESTYQFTSLPGASSYQYKIARLAPFATVETGASGTGDFTVTTTGTYQVITNEETFNGNPSFHLAHETTSEQALEFNDTLIPGSKSALQFESLLGYATNTEVAIAQVSTNGGSTWRNIWSEAGANGAGDTGFNAQSVSLGKYAGEEIMIRFVYDSDGSSYFNQTSTGVGFYLDNIKVTGASVLTDISVNNVTGGNTFGFTPILSGTFALAVRAQAVNRAFPWGPDDIVEAGAAGGGATGIPFNEYVGKYSGAVAESGLIAITLSANGSFSAAMNLDGTTTRFTGQFDADGAYSRTFKNGNQLELQLITQGGAAVTGALVSGSVSNPLALEPAEKAISALAFTFRIPAPAGAGLPQGIGYGTVKMQKGSAATTFAGKLGDGTAITFGGNAIVDGTNTVIPVYISLYGRKGSLTGVVTREATANGDMDGVLEWTKPRTAGPYLSGSFATPVSLYGSLYEKPIPGERVIDLSTANVSFADGDLTNPLQNSVTLATNNKIVVTGADADELKMSINPTNGLFSGSFLAPGAHKVTPFFGALFQGFNMGVGVFKGPDDPGSVNLQ